MKTQILRLAPALIVLGTLAGCSTHQMTTPTDVVKMSEELPVTDRSSWSGALANETFGLGPYKVEDVDRDWNHGSGTGFKWSDDHFGVAGFSSDRVAGGYGFALQGRGGAMKGACATEATDKSLDLGSRLSVGKQTAKVACSCGDDASVLLQESTSEEYGGTLKTSGGSYRIMAIYDRDGGFSDGNPSGYRVDSDKPIGAVDVLKPGRVWISRAVESAERKQLACIFAGLMLYQPPCD